MKWKLSITRSGNYPLDCPYPDGGSTYGYVVNNDQALTRHTLSVHNCKVHIRHRCIASFEELESADAQQRKALYGLRRGGEGDDRRAVTLQLKRKRSTAKSTKDSVGKTIHVQGKRLAKTSRIIEDDVEEHQTQRNVFDKFANVSGELHRPLLADDTQSEVVTSTDDELFQPDHVKKPTTSFSCRCVSTSKTNWSIHSKHSMSKPTDCDSALETPQPLEPLFPELSDVVNVDELYVESERVESTEVIKLQSGDKSSTALPVPRCETPLLVDATAHCGGVTDTSARRRSENTSAGETVLGDSVCGKLDHVLSPYKLVNQKTEEMKRIMDEKRTLIADILQIPLYDCNTIPEVVDEVNDSSDPRKLLFASITRADTLLRVTNKRITTEYVQRQPPEDPEYIQQAVAGFSVFISGVQLLSISTRLHHNLSRLAVVLLEKLQENEQLKSELTELQSRLDSTTNTDNDDKV